MSERRGTKALETWCKRVTDGYPGVKVENMTTSWRDGLAFCAMIHHFRPDLIDFDSLDKRDVYRNNELAFRIAERHLGIPALLDAEDMVEYEVPDRLSMLTYLSQFYQTFVTQQGHSPNSRTPMKRSSVSPSLSSSPDMSPSLSPTSSSPPSKVQVGGVSAGSSSRSLRDPCTSCGLPVFLAERLLVGSKRALYHRICFRCARCAAQLTTANCYETEDGRFCCETCPDEENDNSNISSQGKDRQDSAENQNEDVQVSSHLRRSLSDDEKSTEGKSEVNSDTTSAKDENSATCESAFENLRSISTSQERPKSVPLQNVQQFMHDLHCKSDDNIHESLHNSLVNKDDSTATTSEYQSSNKNLFEDKTKLCTKDPPQGGSNTDSRGCESCPIESDNLTSFSKTEDSVHITNVSSIRSSNYQPVTASTELGEAVNCTKDCLNSSADTGSSIVKMRKMLFECDESNALLEKAKSIRKSSTVFEKSSVSQEYNPEIKDLSNREEQSSSELVEFEDTSQDTEETLQKIETSEIMHQQKSEEEQDKTEVMDENKEQENVISMESLSSSEEVQNDALKNSDEDKLVTEDLKKHTESAVTPSKELVAAKPEPARRSDKSVPFSAGTSEYPTELNPFRDDDDELEENSQENKIKSALKENVCLNPFGSSEEDEEPVVLRKAHKPPRPPPPRYQVTLSNSGLSPSSLRRKTVAEPPETSPTPAQRRIIPAPVSLNPFWSDGEEPEDDSHRPAPVPLPLPRTVRPHPEPSPRPSKSSMMSSSGKFGSSSSLTSMSSNFSTNRRSKKPAPAPPAPSSTIKPPPHPTGDESPTIPSSPCPSLKKSPHHKKARPAPRPPVASVHLSEEKGKDEQPPALTENSWDTEKTQKDEANRSKQAVCMEDANFPRDKSTFGQWKRKKGPAPPRPLPQRRQVRVMPLKEVKRELDDIEIKQLELERQGVKLEQTIRSKFDETPGSIESSITPDVEVLVLQLFELVNEKNELFRRQAELMYLRRQQRLEEEHAELEYQIRCLMDRPERNKTDSDKAREEELIQRLVEVVERRNEIIECLEMDRLREAEEDLSINTRLGLFAAKGMSEMEDSTPSKTKKEKKKKKEKDSKKKIRAKIDADKDIDEVEAAAVAAAAKEKKTKRKWF